MNKINTHPVSALGYGFIEKEFIPKGKDEYYLRYKQNRSKKNYRKLTAAEIKLLKKMTTAPTTGARYWLPMYLM